TLEIASNPLVNEGRGCHHHGNTIDQLPTLLVRPALIEGAERVNRKSGLLSLCFEGHCMLPRSMYSLYHGGGQRIVWAFPIADAARQRDRNGHRVVAKRRQAGATGDL